jgi:NAD(P)-dependent dehydrogenase (short-subunit alcohol dehydrogenase family)
MTRLFNGLEGQVALVSGAARNVGRTYALALAEAGARVIAADMRLEGDPHAIGSLAEVAATGRGRGLDIAPLAMDLRDEASLVRLVADVRARFGRVDVLLNNAVHYVHVGDPLAFPQDDWATAMQVNVRGPYVLMREVIPGMVEQGGGAIINITTAAALPTKKGGGAHDRLLLYGVSKAGLERLTSFMAAEYADRNVAINAISPGSPAILTQQGRQPDLEYWGAPIVHLARQRASDGITGRRLHTYEYGRSWGPAWDPPREWNEHIRQLLRDAGVVDREDPALPAPGVSA